MRQIIAAIVLSFVAVSASAVDFLGVELCAETVDTGVILPAESPLSLESVEVGRHGGLVLLLHSKKGKVLNQVDDLMFGFVGSSGEGDDRKLEWTSEEITAFAQVIKKGYVALAVTATENCTVEPEPAAVEAPVTEDTPPTVGAAPAPIEEVAPAAAAAAVATEPEAEEPAPTGEVEPVAAAAVVAADPDPAPEEPPPRSMDFELKGRLKHRAAEDDWVDVMGVVVNNSGAAYTVASFDLSLYDDAGDLICVDTISVNHLKSGQERAFRGAIRCADYVGAEVASWKLQFAGGH